jgi:hypothetical protein
MYNRLKQSQKPVDTDKVRIYCLENNIPLPPPVRCEQQEGWVKIETRPKPNQTVLLFEDGIHLTFYKYWPKGFSGNSADCFVDMNNRGPISVDEITHWMPLPAHPSDAPTPPAPPQQEGERLYRWVKSSERLPRKSGSYVTLVLVIEDGLSYHPATYTFFEEVEGEWIGDTNTVIEWLEELTTPSPSNGAIFNASEIQRLLTEQQNKH